MELQPLGHISPVRDRFAHELLDPGGTLRAARSQSVVGKAAEQAATGGPAPRCFGVDRAEKVVGRKNTIFAIRGCVYPVMPVELRQRSQLRRVSLPLPPRQRSR
jgi:hypothetical protein